MRILVAGSTGFIGRHLVNALRENHEIFGMSRNATENAFSDIKSIGQDFTKPMNSSQVPETIDAVIHLAQSEYFRDFPEHSVDLFQVNTVSTLLLLEYSRAAGAKSFVYASSGGIYGYSDERFTEDADVKPDGELGFYLGSKLCSEIICDCYARFMNVIVLRFFFVYGPGQKKNMLMPRLIDAVRRGEPIILQGREGIKINPTYVSDAVKAICAALELKVSQKINVGGPQILSLRTIGEIIGKTVGKKPRFEINHDSEPRHLVGDISKMRKVLIEPKIPFESGIQKYLQAERDLDGKKLN